MSGPRIRIPAGGKPVRPGRARLGGSSPEGNRIEVNGSWLSWNGKPWFPVGGEFHYSRFPAEGWADELARMKLGGVDIVFTYAFWNHHEEVQGELDWSGCRDLRRFVETCAEAGLLVLVRIGPFCHGEVRNGGLPDWLYGRTFTVRSNDPGYMDFVKRWFTAVAGRLKGLLFGDGGPVVGIQIENEHGHAGAPWEQTVGTTSDWVPAGRDGESHMLALKRMAVEAGLVAPLYTCTAWGGASAPVDEMLPMWGGYSFQPWIFYGEAKSHPPTPEYIFRDFHNDGAPSTYNFTPRYAPEDLPYACCELMGGMTVSYAYRFVLPMESIAALAVVKLAGGANLLGYYMYHGGTNPRGRLTPFLNEHHVPKMSYDFQAPIGECGRMRRSFHELRLIHMFLHEHGGALCRTVTHLPPGAGEIDPADPDPLRWAARSEGGRGFLFLCNYQDHAEVRAHRDVSVGLDLPRGETLRIPDSGGFTLEAGVSCILPFHMDLDGLDLLYATAQPVTTVRRGGETTWFFASPPGMAPEYALKVGGAVRVLTPGKDGVIELPGPARRWIVTLPWDKALTLWRVECADGPRVLLTEAAPLPSPGGLRLEQWGGGSLRVRAWPALPAASTASGSLAPDGAPDGFFTSSRADLPAFHAEDALTVTRHGPLAACIRLDPAVMDGVKDAVLSIAYRGDIAEAFVDGQMVSDNFSNGQPWQIRVSHLPAAVFRSGLDVRITPVREGSRVISDTPMAGRSRARGGESGEILSVEAIAIWEVSVPL